MEKNKNQGIVWVITVQTYEEGTKFEILEER